MNSELTISSSSRVADHKPQNPLGSTSPTVRSCVCTGTAGFLNRCRKSNSGFHASVPSNLLTESSEMLVFIIQKSYMINLLGATVNLVYCCFVMSQSSLHILTFLLVYFWYYIFSLKFHVQHPVGRISKFSLSCIQDSHNIPLQSKKKKKKVFSGIITY